MYISYHGGNIPYHGGRQLIIENEAWKRRQTGRVVIVLGGLVWGCYIWGGGGQKNLYYFDSFRGFIEQFSLFLNQSNDVLPPPNLLRTGAVYSTI